MKHLKTFESFNYSPYRLINENGEYINQIKELILSFDEDNIKLVEGLYSITYSYDTPQNLINFKEEYEKHWLCKDTKHQTAWVARRDGELRCFLEGDNYPHRAWGRNIDADPEDVPISGS